MSRFVLILLFVFACFPARATNAANLDAQIKITGSVDDPSGATVFGANVELLDANGGLVASTTTLRNGQFQMAARPETISWPSCATDSPPPFHHCT